MYYEKVFRGHMFYIECGSLMWCTPCLSITWKYVRTFAVHCGPIGIGITLLGGADEACLGN